MSRDDSGDDPTPQAEGRPELKDPLEPDPTILADDRTEVAPPGPAERPADSEPEPLPTTQIGGYRLLGKLGEGGMGTVFEAEQQSPRRRVALKVIRGGAFVDELQVRMFRREVSTLGLLKHPGIGAIYDAGRTDEGQHFFAMELVEGRELGKYLEGRPARPDREETEHRLEMFRKICEAVHYAHQRGVIHRDLKPSNIVVLGERDGDGAAAEVPEIKILDFGLARITEAEVPGATMVSQSGLVQGTLPYMSPEQARGETANLDLRTDVYSLGVILYEMLAGARPYETGRSSLLEAVRVICEVAPRPFSAVWDGKRRIDADLETIVGKALEKEADRRYGSALALSEDVERYLTAQPIQARPPSTAYQLQKLVQRNRLPTAFAATILVLLVGFAIWMSVLYGRATQAEELATREAETASQVSDFMVNLFEVSDPSEAQGNTITAREILDRGAEKIDRELATQPVIQARLLHTVGKVYRSLGLLQPSGELLSRALALREEVLGRSHPEVSRSLVELGAGEATLGAFEAAERHLERALAIQRADPGIEETEVAETLRHLAFLFREQGRWAEAAEIYESLVPLQERLLGSEDPELATTLEELGRFYHELSRYEEFEEMEERAFAIREKALGPDHPDVGASLYQLADAYSHTGRRELRVATAERALAIQEKALGAIHPDVAFTLHTLAGGYLDLGRLAEAEAAYRRAIEIAERLGATQHPRFGLALCSLAQVYNAQRRYLEAVPLLERGLAIAERGFGRDSPNLIFALNSLGHAYFYAGLPDRARTPLERSFQIATALGPDHADLAVAAYLLASVSREQGRLTEAERLFTQALEIQDKRPGENDHLLADTLVEQAILFRSVQRLDEARTTLERAQSVVQQADFSDETHLAAVLHEQAVILGLQGELDEARSRLERALAIRRAAFGVDHELTRESREALAALDGEDA